MTFEFEYECSARLSHKCEPFPSLGFHLSRGAEPDDTSCVYLPITRSEFKGKVALPRSSGGSAAAPTLFVSMFAFVTVPGPATGNRRVDTCIIDSSNVGVPTASQQNKFKITVRTAHALARDAGECKTLVAARAAGILSWQFGKQSRWLIDYARAASYCSLLQPEGRVCGEYYFYYQSQYKRRLSLKMHTDQLAAATFMAGSPSADAVPKDIGLTLEIIKEKLTTVAHSLLYARDQVDLCTGSCEIEQLTLPCCSGSYAEILRAATRTPTCSNKKFVDYASNPLDVCDHGLACCDCEDNATVTCSMALQDKAALRHADQRKLAKEAPLLKHVLETSSRYTYLATFTLIKDDPVSDDEIMRLASRSGSSSEQRYEFSQRDVFNNVLTCHMTVIAVDTRLALSCAGTGAPMPPLAEVLPTFLVEPTRWMYSRPEREPAQRPASAKFNRRFSRSKFVDLFRQLEPDISAWYFCISVVYSEELRRVTGKGEYALFDKHTECFGVLFKTIFDTKAWAKGRYALVPTSARTATKEEDRDFQKACATLSDSEGACFLPRERDSVPEDSDAKRREAEQRPPPAADAGRPPVAALLATTEFNWGFVEKDFAAWAASAAYSYSVTRWPISKGITRVCVTVYEK